MTRILLSRPVRALAGLALAGCGMQASNDAQTSDPIIGGSVDSADRAVVLFTASLEGGIACTAEFISPTVLLTAAHCVTADGHPHVVPSNAQFQLIAATSEATAPDSAYIDVRTANVHPHPDYDGDHYADIAVVLLDHPYPVTPLALPRAPLSASLVGSSVRIVGYGEHSRQFDPGAPMVRRSVTTKLRSVGASMILVGRTGQQACDGDSGGPAILDVHGVPTIIGTDDIASNSVDCTNGDYYQRVDRWLPFIQRYLD